MTDPRHDRLVSLLYGELDGEEAARLHAEMRSDRELAAQWQLLREAHEGLGAPEPVALPTGLEDRILAAARPVLRASAADATGATGAETRVRRSPWRLAAPALGVLAALALLLVVFRPSPPGPGPDSQASGLMAQAERETAPSEAAEASPERAAAPAPLPPEGHADALGALLALAEPAVESADEAGTRAPMARESALRAERGAPDPEPIARAGAPAVEEVASAPERVARAAPRVRSRSSEPMAGAPTEAERAAAPEPMAGAPTEAGRAAAPEPMAGAPTEAGRAAATGSAPSMGRSTGGSARAARRADTLAQADAPSPAAPRPAAPISERRVRAEAPTGPPAEAELDMAELDMADADMAEAEMAEADMVVTDMRAEAQGAQESERLAVAQERRSRAEEQRTRAERLPEGSPERLTLLLEAGRSHAAEGAPRRARSLYRQVIREGPESPQAEEARALLGLE